MSDSSALASLVAELGAVVMLQAEVANLQQALANRKTILYQADAEISDKARRIDELVGENIKLETRVMELAANKELMRAQVVQLSDENRLLCQSLKAAHVQLSREYVCVENAISDLQCRSADIDETCQEVVAALEFAASGVQQGE